MFAPYHKLNNLTLIVDYNKQQLDDFTDKILSLEPLADKFRAFCWNVVEIDGHDMQACVDALREARDNQSERPTCIVAHTIKGKGVSFMENNVKWHGVAPKADEVAAAVKELEAKVER